MKEVELFKPVKNLLLKNGCSQVYGEVLGCDVLGIDGALDNSRIKEEFKL